MHIGISPEQWSAMSDKERFDHVNVLKRTLTNYIEYFFRIGAITSAAVEIDSAIFEEVVRSYFEDLGRISDRGGPSDPNDFKQKAFYTFWIRKLKPIQESNSFHELHTEIGTWINEIVALLMAITELDVNHGCDILNEIPAAKRASFVRDLLYFFRFKSVSPHAMYLVLNSMYLFADSHAD